MTLKEAKKKFSNSKAGERGKSLDPQFMKAFAHFMEVEKLVGWKSMTFFFMYYQRNEHQGDAYGLKNKVL